MLLAVVLFDVGRVEEASRFARRARSLDPLSLQKAVWTVPMLGAAGRPDEALDTAERLGEGPECYSSAARNSCAVRFSSFTSRQA